MITANAAMDFLKGVVPMISSDTLEIRGNVTSFLKDIIDDCILCRSVSYPLVLGFLVWEDLSD